MRRRERFGRIAVTFAAGGLLLLVGACNLALGLDKYKDCSGPACVTATCSDGAQDGDETDVDCGGTCMKKCDATQKCQMGTDCTSGACVNDACVADPCMDGVKDLGEPDTDCGGPCSTKCADMAACFVGADCVSGVCSGGTCRPAMCGDGITNGMETDTDCGGPVCGKCPFMKMCLKDADCVGGKCNGTCQAACNDTVKNGDETDTDCGGTTCPACKDTQGCLADPDCTSGICQSTKCAPVGVWSVGFNNTVPGTGQDIHSFVAVDPTGIITAFGDFDGAVDFGGGIFTAMGNNENGYVVRLDKTGTFIDAAQIPCSFLLGAGIAADKTGNILYTGIFDTRMDLGNCHLFTNPAGESMFVVGGGSTPANPTICRVFGTTYPNPTPNAVIADGAGNWFVSGSLQGTSDFGTTGSPASVTGPGAFLVKLNPSGNTVWAKSFVTTPSSNTAQITSMAFDSVGNLLVVGTFAGTLTMGQALPSATTNDLFAAKLTPAGAVTWAKGFGGHIQGNPRVAVDGNDNVFLAGDFTGSLNFGNGPVTTGTAFLAELTSGGAYSWAKTYGTAGTAVVTATGLAVDGMGRPEFTGTFTSTVDFGGGSLTSVGGSTAAQIYLVKLDTSGNYLWGRQFGDTKGEKSTGLTLDPTGAVIMNGTYKGQLDFLENPPMPLMTKGYANMFIAKLNTP